MDTEKMIDDYGVRDAISSAYHSGEYNRDRIDALENAVEILTREAHARKLEIRGLGRALEGHLGLRPWYLLHKMLRIVRDTG